MSVFKGSRYEGSSFIGIVNDIGESKKFLEIKRKPITQDDLVGETRVHKVKTGETLDYIAFLYYQREDFWWAIAEVNEIMFFYNISPGDQLLIPDRRVFESLPKSEVEVSRIVKV